MGGRMLCILLYRIPYPTVVPAAFGVVCKPDPSPNPSLSSSKIFDFIESLFPVVP